MATEFSASSSALGYFYQARYALLLLIQAEPDAELSIEKFDDVAFEQAGDPVELLQLKHHLARGSSLGDKSADLWKTIRVWAETQKERLAVGDPPILTLITTATASEGSIASLLRPATNRAVGEADRRLHDVATEAGSQDNARSYAAYLALSDFQRQQLVAAIRVLDNCPDISDAAASIKHELRWSVRPDFIDALFERVEGWWFSLVVRHLRGDDSEPISRAAVQNRIMDLAEQFRSSALPIDYQSLEPPDQTGFDGRRFVRQLQLIASSNESISIAIRDYYRAFTQRSRWVREELLALNELDKYETRLVDEWQHWFARMKDDLPADADEERIRRDGRSLYWALQSLTTLPIRPECQEPYVLRGSWHILADKQPKSSDDGRTMVGWHPMFLDRLEALMEQTVGSLT